MPSKASARTSPITYVKPRIIIHGGAGNITRATVPRDRYDEYRASLLRILDHAVEQLSVPGATALDVATFAVTLLEDDPLYNSGKGAVFTREGKNELECSIMVSNGYKKRGVGCMLLRQVKNPIKLARELLIKGEDIDGGGAGDHCQFSGEFVEGLAETWGLEIVDPSYFFTQKRWDEHLRGLAEEEKNMSSTGASWTATSDWEKQNYIPLGTCGAVVVDSFGTVCTATSTGGLTNKVPGRIGDTPTLGAGFWAEEWYEEGVFAPQMLYQPTPSVASPVDKVSRGDLGGALNECLQLMSSPRAGTKTQAPDRPCNTQGTRRAVGLSGTGNGDSFLRICAARTTAARCRFSSRSLRDSTTWMAGRRGELQRSAGDRWDGVHEGVGGIIGIEVTGDQVKIAQDFNGGGMFWAWTEEDGSHKCLVFREEGWETGPP